jgi:hypothetical protein
MQDWPRTTRDQVTGQGREWLHLEIPRYYLYKLPDSELGKWVVVDRCWDIAVSKPTKRKCDAIKSFVRMMTKATQSN